MYKKILADISYFLLSINPFLEKIKIKCDYDFILHAYKHDVIGRKLYKTKKYDRTLSERIINKFTDSSGNFIDIGANLGYFTCLLAHVSNNQGKILAIEPEPNNHELLQINVNNNNLASKVFIYNSALGESEGVALLNVYKKSNRGRHSMVSNGSGSSIEVPVQRLDKLVSKHFDCAQVIDLIKLDVEGYEPFVIRGAGNVLDRTKYLVMEYAPYLLKHSGMKINEFMEHVASKFSKMYLIEDERITPTSLHEILNRSDSVDILFEK